MLTHFRAGEFHEVVWVDMPPTGVTWEVHGQKATVDLSSPVCTFEHSRVVLEGHPGMRSFTGANRPPLPGTVKQLLFAHNALGAGTLVQESETSGDVVHTYSVLSQGGDLDAMLRPILGQAPVIAQAGPRPDPVIPVELEVVAQAEREGIWENAIVELKATVGGITYPRKRYDAESAHCDDGFFVWTTYKPCGAGDSVRFFGGVQDLAGSVDFDFYEPDDHSADEHIWARMTIDTANGVYRGYSDCPDCERAHFTNELGDRRAHWDGKGNRADCWVREVTIPTITSGGQRQGRINLKIAPSAK